LVAVRASITGRLIHESSSDEEDWVAGMQEPVFADEDFEDEDEISLSEMFEQIMREEEMAAGKDSFAIDNKLPIKLYVNADCDREWLTNRKTSSSSATSLEGGVDVLKIGGEAGGSHSSAQSKEETYEFTKQTSGFTLIPPQDTKTFYLPSCLKGKVYLWIRYQNPRTKQWYHPNKGSPTKIGTYTVTASKGHLRLNQLCAGDDTGCNIDGGLGLGDGDCDSGRDCAQGLICGKDNCMSNFGHRGGQWDEGDDCCTNECRKSFFEQHAGLAISTFCDRYDRVSSKGRREFHFIRPRS